MSDGRVRVAVLGATGYAGVELLRLLARHPAVELTFLSSEQYRERRTSEIHPFLTGVVETVLRAPEPAAVAEAADVVFAALPHGASAPIVSSRSAEGVPPVALNAGRVTEFTRLTAACIARPRWRVGQRWTVFFCRPPTT